VDIGHTQRSKHGQIQDPYTSAEVPSVQPTANSKMVAPTMELLLASPDILADMFPVKRLPNAKSNVAPNISHGKTLRKVCAGVLISSKAPATPPITLVTISGMMTRLGISSFMRVSAATRCGADP